MEEYIYIIFCFEQVHLCSLHRNTFYSVKDTSFFGSDLVTYMIWEVEEFQVLLVKNVTS